MIPRGKLRSSQDIHELFFMHCTLFNKFVLNLKKERGEKYNYQQEGITQILFIDSFISYCKYILLFVVDWIWNNSVLNGKKSAYLYFLAFSISGKKLKNQPERKHDELLNCIKRYQTKKNKKKTINFSGCFNSNNFQLKIPCLKK